MKKVLCSLVILSLSSDAFALNPFACGREITKFFFSFMTRAHTRTIEAEEQRVRKAYAKIADVKYYRELRFVCEGKGKELIESLLMDSYVGGMPYRGEIGEWVGMMVARGITGFERKVYRSRQNAEQRNDHYDRIFYVITHSDGSNSFILAYQAYSEEALKKMGVPDYVSEFLVRRPADGVLIEASYSNLRAAAVIPYVQPGNPYSTWRERHDSVVRSGMAFDVTADPNAPVTLTN